MATLRVTYSSGRAEEIHGVERVAIGDKNSATLEVLGPAAYWGGWPELVKTLVLVNVESYEWVKP